MLCSSNINNYYEIDPSTVQYRGCMCYPTIVPQTGAALDEHRRDCSSLQKLEGSRTHVTNIFFSIIFLLQNFNNNHNFVYSNYMYGKPYSESFDEQFTLMMFM